MCDWPWTPHAAHLAPTCAAARADGDSVREAFPTSRFTRARSAVPDAHRWPHTQGELGPPDMLVQKLRRGQTIETDLLNLIKGLLCVSVRDAGEGARFSTVQRGSAASSVHEWPPASTTVTRKKTAPRECFANASAHVPESSHIHCLSLQARGRMNQNLFEGKIAS